MTKRELIEYLSKIKGDPEIRIQLPLNKGTMGLIGQYGIKKEGRTLYIGLNPNDNDSCRVFKGY